MDNIESQQLSIIDCIDSKGQIIIEKFLLYFRQDDDEMDVEDQQVNQPRNRSCKRKDHGKVCDDGTIYNPSATDSVWYMTYVNTPQVNSNDFQKDFRLRFRVPFYFFQELTLDIKSNDTFQRWCGTDCTGSPSMPIELLILGVLRTLARSSKFDDLTEYTLISEENHRQFFHVFMSYGATVLYPRYIKTPTTKEELRRHLKHYARKGLHGAVGSMLIGKLIGQRSILNFGR